MIRIAFLTVGLLQSFCLLAQPDYLVKKVKSLYADMVAGQAGENTLVRMAINGQTNWGIIGGGISASEPFRILGGPKPGDSYYQGWYVSAGKMAKTSWFIATIKAVPVLMKNTKYQETDYTSCGWFGSCTGMDEKVKRSVGLHLQGEFMPAWRWIGVSSGFFVNIGKYSFGGFTMGLAFGNVNYKRKPKDY
jgi:hypothetical protein